jgi:hypothetical protein
VIHRVGRRALEALAAFFAVLGFCTVPLGQRTGLEHTRAILRSEPAQAAARDLVGAFGSLKQRLLEEKQETTTNPLSRSVTAPSPADRADAGADASVEWVH